MSHRHRKKKLPTDPVAAEVTGMSHDGRGIASVNGKTTFITGALPGEHVTFTYLNRRSRFDEGQVQTIQQAAKERITPICQHFSICGGCSLQHLDTTSQQTLKQNMLLEQLQHFAGIRPENLLPVLSGPTDHYRRKARLGVKYVAPKQKVLVGFREMNGRYIADLNRCEILDARVGDKILALKDLIQNLDAYREIPQIEVSMGDTKCASRFPGSATLHPGYIDSTNAALIFRHLSPLNESDQNKLAAFGQTHALEIYLQPGGMNTVHRLWPDTPPEPLSYQLPEHNIEIRFQPTDFTQVNAEINQKMVNLAIELLAPESHDSVLDLFCGLGNFTLPIARRCKNIIGVEGDLDMVKRAQENALHNQITNAQFYAANLAENFHHASWAQQAYEKILLDPPRTGAFELVKHLPKLSAKRIVYVSCNPATLARDAKELVGAGYQLTHAGIMDMFPHTRHVESIAVFNKP